ncbi:MAG: amidohydrolase family protein, partial [Gammaproteobacteria bacterium]|nr:amidohydrolase family protein [Gammaproteobacteria bacterium]
MPVDLIVYGDHVLTMAEVGLIADGAVAIDDGRIVAVDRATTINRKYRAARTIAGDNKVVLPGLVNGHTHAAMSLLRGIADDLALIDWLENYIFPAEVALVDADFVRVGTELACWEMIRGGTTAFVDMYYF